MSAKLIDSRSNEVGETFLVWNEELGSGGTVLAFEVRTRHYNNGVDVRFSSNDVARLRDALEPYDPRTQNDEINSRAEDYGERYRSVITSESDDVPAYGGTNKDDLIEYQKWLEGFTTRFLSNLDELEEEEFEDDEEEEAIRSYADGKFTAGDKVEFLGVTGTVINVSATYGWQVPVQFDEREGTFSYINSLDLEKIDE